MTCLKGKIMIHSISTFNADFKKSEVEGVPTEHAHLLEYYRSFQNKYSLDIPSNSLLSFDLEDNKLTHLSIFEKIKKAEKVEKTLTFKNIMVEVDRILDKSVRDMIGDRNIVKEPVGVLFSGGLDSTLIAYYVLKNVVNEVP